MVKVDSRGSSGENGMGSPDGQLGRTGLGYEENRGFRFPSHGIAG